MIRRRTRSRAWVVVPAFVVVTALARDPEVTRYTIDGGSTGPISGAGFELAGTVGQPDAAELTGGGYSLSAGFWFQLEPANCNADSAIDLRDQELMIRCLDGPDRVPVDDSCSCFDLDGDRDVDLKDAALFQQAFEG